MTDEEILAALTEILAGLVGAPALALAPGDLLHSIPGWSGFVELSLLSVAESRFGLSFPPDATRQLGTVGDLVALVAERQGRAD
jgi:acyl carrier protein